MFDNDISPDTKVYYQKSDKSIALADIKSIHWDSQPTYYTITMNGREIQTERKRLFTNEDIVEMKAVLNEIELIKTFLTL